MNYEALGDADGRILLEGETIAEIRGLALCNVRFRAGGETLIGSEVPLPLYWRQYHGHEDEDRNASSFPLVERLHGNEEYLSLRATGANSSKNMLSECCLRIQLDRKDGGISYLFDSAIRIENEPWRVTRHGEHGDLEFLNLMPVGVFDAARPEAKRYAYCLVRNGNGTLRIPHNHFRTRDKSNIVLRPGDMFIYALEDENPAVEMLAPRIVEAGLCAYMWDAQFGLRICADGTDAWLRPGAGFRAAFRLFAMKRADTNVLLETAREEPDDELARTPVYNGGLHRFDESAMDALSRGNSWPWDFEAGDESAEGFMDKAEGFDDHCSIAIRHETSCASRWTARSLGPAFGEKPFDCGVRLDFSARILTREFRGSARLLLRIHRSGSPDLFDAGKYEVFRCEAAFERREDWTEARLTTPPLSPPPDRVHMVLEAEGDGVCRFDNVLLNRLPFPTAAEM